MSIDWTIAGTFVVYLLVVFAIGWTAYQRTASLSDYLLGGRRLGSWVTALSAQASDMSGWLLMGLPGLAYRIGLGAVWIALGIWIGTYLNWRFVAARLRRATAALNNALTIPDYLEARFNDHSRLLRVTAAVVVMVFFTIYTAAALKAGGELLFEVFAMPFVPAVLAGAAVILTYTAIGGFLAVSWTDTLQGVLMFLALVATMLTGLWALGGLEGARAAAAQQDRDLLSGFVGAASDPITPLSVIGYLGWGLGYFGQPHILVRFMAIREAEQLHRSRHVAMSWVSVCLFAAVAVGVMGAAYLAQPLPDKAASERVFMVVVQQLFHPVIAGVCLAGILAAVMSTADSQLLVASSAVAEDFYKTLFRPDASEREVIWLGRAAVAAIASAAAAIVLLWQSAVLTLVGYAWAGFGAAFGPTILISLFWQRMTRGAAVAGVMTGGMSVVVWKHAGAIGGLIGLEGAGELAIFQLYALVPGFVLSLAAIGAVSWAWGVRHEA